MDIKEFYYGLPLAQKLWRFINHLLENAILRIDNFHYAKVQFRHEFGRKMNLRRPKNLIEKFYWIEKNADLSLMTKCADKYAVREFVEERGCGEILNELYAKWDTPEEIDFDVLPDSFILKINNGSGDVTIVEDKNKVDKQSIIEHFKELYKVQYGRQNAQFHYSRIKPCIIAEKLLPVENIPYSCSIIDYKVWCFDGKPECIWLAYDRSKSKRHVYMDLFDTEWNSMPQYMKSIPHYQYHPENVIPKPTSLDEMLRYASVLSKGFPEVRVDFYEIGGKVIFGEMTFTSGYGYLTPEYYEYLGEKTDLSILSKR